jgi:hypothetical protein
MQWPPTPTPGVYRWKFHLVAGCGENIFDVDIQGWENSSQFVDEGDVDVALNVFDDFGCFCHFEFADITNILAG